MKTTSAWLLFAVVMAISACQTSAPQDAKQQAVKQHSEPNDADSLYHHWKGLLFVNQTGKIKYLSVADLDGHKTEKLNCIRLKDSCLTLINRGEWFIGSNYYQNDAYHFYVRKQAEGISISAIVKAEDEPETWFFEHSAYLIQNKSLYFMDQSPCSEGGVIKLMDNVDPDEVKIMDDRSWEKDYVHGSNDYLMIGTRIFWRGCEVLEADRKNYPIEKLNALNKAKKYAAQMKLTLPKINQ